MSYAETVAASVLSAIVTTLVVIWPYVKSALAKYEIRLKTVGIQHDEFIAMQERVVGLEAEVARLNDVVSAQVVTIDVLQKYVAERDDTIDELNKTIDES